MSAELARRLQAYLAEAGQQPFDWAGHHCCHFAGRWVELVEGFDPLFGLPVTPDAAAAWRLIHRMGGLPATITRRLQRPAMASGMAWVGDVVLLPLERLGGPCGHWTVGLCDGRTSVFVMPSGATVHWPTTCASHAWRVEPGRIAQTSAQRDLAA
jgi:hypothetical protein